MSRGIIWSKDRVNQLINIDGESGCWVWKGKPLQNSGYGRVKIKGKSYVAHRAVYELFKYAIPEGMQLDHLCRNRLCVNPDHLDPVTPYENQLRGNTFTWEKYLSTACSRGHNKSPENGYFRKDGRYRCRICKNLKQRELMKQPRYKEAHVKYERERRKRLKDNLL